MKKRFQNLWEDHPVLGPVVGVLGTVLPVGILLGVIMIHLTGVNVHATDFPLAQSASTVNATLLSSTAYTNVTGSAQSSEAGNYHTIHFVNSGTNNIGCILERSLDNSNWVIGSTNVAASGGGIVEATLTGKYGYVRARILGTNSTVVVTYLGGR